MVGTSDTPLARKLGIRPGHRIAILAAPDGFRGELAPLPDGVSVARALRGTRDYDVIVLFSLDRARLAGALDRAARRIAPAGALWLAWPKKASGVETDLSFEVVQGAGLGHGLVDNKVCVVNEVFSGLRFVVRKQDRSRWAEGDRSPSRSA